MEKYRASIKITWRFMGNSEAEVREAFANLLMSEAFRQELTDQILVVKKE